MIKLIDEAIENISKEEALKRRPLERIDENMTKIVPIMMMTKQGAAEDYFYNILQKFYSAEEREFCRNTVHSWFTDLAQEPDDVNFMDLLDTLLDDDAYRLDTVQDWSFGQTLKLFVTSI